MILITGGMGFIGLHTARSFLDSGEDVLLTWYHTERRPDFIEKELGKRAFAEQVDIADATGLRSLAERYPLTGIVHLAVPALGVLSPADDFRVNMQGLMNVLELGTSAGIRRVILASSVTVYAGVERGPFTENLPLRMYGATPTEVWKKNYELIGRHYGDRAGIEVISLRIGLIWGPLYHSMANVPSRFAHAAVRGVPSDAVGRGGGIVPYEQDGGDFCYVKDCATGIRQAQLAGKLNHAVYNLSEGLATTYAQFAEAVRRVLPEAELKLKRGRGPSWRPDPHMDISRAREDFGFQPSYELTDAMSDYLAWLKQHPI